MTTDLITLPLPADGIKRAMQTGRMSAQLRLGHITGPVTLERRRPALRSKATHVSGEVLAVTFGVQVRTENGTLWITSDELAGIEQAV